MAEVRFDRMVPSQVVRRRERCNLAYLPVGSLEWHGPHMPFGTDYMTVDYLARRAARRFGGVAFPPMYYADVRFFLQECRPEWRRTYAREMAVPAAYADAFGLEHMETRDGARRPFADDDGEAPDEPLPFTPREMERDFTRQIARAMMEIHLYGFRRIVLLPGHGPNPAYCEAAREVYRRNVLRRKALGTPARTLSFFYLDAAAEPLLENHWIHADKWEASVTMLAAPGTVKLHKLPASRRKLAPAYLGYPYLSESEGYNPAYKHLWYSFDALDPRSGASIGYGRKQWRAVLEALGQKVKQFVATAPLSDRRDERRRGPRRKS